MTPVSRLSMTRPAKGALFMGLFAALWTVIELLGQSLSSGYSPYQIVWTRYLVHVLLSIGVMLAVKRSISIRTGQWRMQILRSAMMLVMPVAFVFAVHGASTGSVWSVLWLAPILTMAGGRLLHGSAVSAIDWLVVAVCFSGVVLTLHPDSDMSLKAASWALLSAASFGAYLMMTASLRTDSIWTSLFYTAIVPFVVLSAAMPAVWTPVSLHAGIVLVAIGVTGWLGLMLLDKSIRLLMPAHAAVFIYVQVVIDGLVVHRLDNARSMIGAGIVVCGLICAAVTGTRRKTIVAAGAGAV